MAGLETQNRNLEEDSAKKLEKDAQEKKDIEGILSSENNEAGGENGTGEEKIDKTKAVNLITENIQEKSKNINDEQTKAQIEALMQEITAFNRPGKLTPEEKIQLSDIYKKIKSLHGKENAENAKAGDEAQKGMKNNQEISAKNLLEATEKLRDFMKANTDQQKQAQLERKADEKTDKKNNPPPDLDLVFPVSEASPENKSK